MPLYLQPNLHVRPDGGIGRRSRLKICRSQGCAGSIPVLGTILKRQSTKRIAFLFYTQSNMTKAQFHFMKRLVLSTLYCFTITFCIAQSQGQMTQDAIKNYKKVDQELNIVYQKILTEYKEDTAFIKNFKAAQRLWVQFRDAEMKAKYPDREEGYYGSVQPMCWYMHLSYLTEERRKAIEIWLTGIEEGDVCSGSVKTKG